MVEIRDNSLAGVYILHLGGGGGGGEEKNMAERAEGEENENLRTQFVQN